MKNREMGNEIKETAEIRNSGKRTERGSIEETNSGKRTERQIIEETNSGRRTETRSIEETNSGWRTDAENRGDEQREEDGDTEVPGD
ncbi:hypothetical protein NDU88_003555 [Pleurodeles waltl]|uniref:Uncharacterized protein n=1 Tax=Pleurodeles waltl TaxID=8319 RepID=A0AAV7KV75_PLEWA|nr:hypothetical protein NDU88_003555 [Pleurodeles waltl]